MDRWMDRSRQLSIGCLALVASLLLGCTSSGSTPAPSGPCLRIGYRIVTATGVVVTQDQADFTRFVTEARLATLHLPFATVEAESPTSLRVDVPADADQDRVTALVTPVGRLQFVPLPPDDVSAAGDPIDARLPALFGIEAISSVNASQDAAGAPQVEFRLRTDHTAAFATWTTAHVGERFAIVRDGTILSVPAVMAPITTGEGTIGGLPSDAAAVDLVTVLTTGTLPFPVEEVDSEIASCS